MYGDAFATATKDNVVELFGGLLSDPDKAVFETEATREDFAASLRQGFEFGWRGFFDDDQAMMKEWGFDPAAITVPVSVWFGDQDLMVPRTHGEWLVDNLPTASKHFFPGDGHVSMVSSHLDELFAAIDATYA
jgi:pimeloyl-ACP methyl ester carboxylesterase